MPCAAPQARRNPVNDLRGHGQEMLGVTGYALDRALEYLGHPVDF